MQVKVFEAKDMATGLKMVKEALGPDALILSTRTIGNGTFGVIGKPMMEITAAVDSAWKEPPARQQPQQNQSWARETEQTSSRQADITYDEIWAQNRTDFSAKAPNNRSSQGKPDLEAELAELRQMVKGLSNRMAGADSSVLRKPYIEPEFISASQTLTKDPAITFLNEYGINDETAQVVARFTRDTINKLTTPDCADLSTIFKAAIARLFTTDKVLAERPAKQRRISVIGPTGVGKTTTLAKIAAQYLSRFGGRVALVTIDTYRIAAVEQLKVYGEIMRLPVEVVIKPRELDLALERLHDFDLVLIDTAGRSPRNGGDLQELANFIRPHLGIENHLILPATTRERELEEIIRRFSIVPVSNFIFSKLDECDQLGVLLNIHYKNDTPVSFLTNGQRVPEDLIMPSPATIAELIIDEERMSHHG